MDGDQPVSTQLWTHCRVATLAADAAAPYGLIEDAALVVQGEQITWVGARADLPSALAAQCSQQHDAGGALITPGLIDCHTHLVYGGDRAHEFELRLNGATYEDIARAGGGIASTVQATRAASAAELTGQSLPRLRALMAEGVTTVRSNPAMAWLWRMSAKPCRWRAIWVHSTRSMCAPPSWGPMPCRLNLPAELMTTLTRCC